MFPFVSPYTHTTYLSVRSHLLLIIPSVILLVYLMAYLLSAFSFDCMLKVGKRSNGIDLALLGDQFNFIILCKALGRHYVIKGQTFFLPSPAFIFTLSHACFPNPIATARSANARDVTIAFEFANECECKRRKSGSTVW